MNFYLQHIFQLATGKLGTPAGPQRPQGLPPAPAQSGSLPQDSRPSSAVVRAPSTAFNPHLLRLLRGTHPRRRAFLNQTLRSFKFNPRQQLQRKRALLFSLLLEKGLASSLLT